MTSPAVKMPALRLIIQAWILHFVALVLYFLNMLRLLDIFVREHKNVFSSTLAHFWLKCICRNKQRNSKARHVLNKLQKNDQTV